MIVGGLVKCTKFALARIVLGVSPKGQILQEERLPLYASRGTSFVPITKTADLRKFDNCSHFRRLDGLR